MALLDLFEPYVAYPITASNISKQRLTASSSVRSPLKATGPQSPERAPEARGGPVGLAQHGR